MAKTELRQRFEQRVMAHFQPHRGVELAALCDSIGLPQADLEQGLSKRQVVQARLDVLPDERVHDAIERFLGGYGAEIGAADRFDLEEALWLSRPSLGLTKKVRRNVSAALRGAPLFLDADKFLKLVDRLWNRDSAMHEVFGRPGLLDAVERHCVRNPEDWSAVELLEHVGAWDVSDQRFVAFLEGLIGPDVRPDDTEQRRFATVVNDALAGTGLELREVGEVDGYPCFRVASFANALGPPKNLIFASWQMPDLRLKDAVSNDVEIVEGAENVLVYDRPFSRDGLRWRDLQLWYAEKYAIPESQAKTALYRRLEAALPPTSPPQQLLFRSYFKAYGGAIPDLPALVPEVWLHWDPRTVAVRGPRALTGLRMDFLMLLPGDVRVVLEVDGARHYTDDVGRPSPSKYAAMVRGDRDLRLLGYEVYRFGGGELDGASAPKLVADFFSRLFARHRVSPRASR